MNALNSIILEGNLTKDGELKNTSFSVCSLSLAVNRYYKNKDGDFTEEVSFFDVECFGTMADVAEKNAKKGRGIRVVGRLKQDRWTDENGKTYSKVKVIAEHIEFKPMFKKMEDVAAAEPVTEPVTIEENQDVGMCF